MTDTREQIRMRLWVDEYRVEGSVLADKAVEEFDKRFPKEKSEGVPFSKLKSYHGDISNFESADVVEFNCAEKTVALRFEVMPSPVGIGQKWIVRTQDCSQP